MERNYYGYIWPWQYVTNFPEPAYVRDGRPCYEGTVPVAFRQAPFYDDGFMRGCCGHIPVLGRPDLLPGEQAFVWRDGECGARQWWRNPDHPHDARDGHRICIDDPDCEQDSKQTVEFYVPLCCDYCERKVKDYLISLPGVDKVATDQQKKRVVMVGRDLRPHEVLRSLQRYLDLPRSALWEHRPR